MSLDSGDPDVLNLAERVILYRPRTFVVLVSETMDLELVQSAMSRRMKSDELDLLISAVLTSAQVGANLVDILEVCTATVNDRIKIKDEIRILSAQGKTSGLILSILPLIIILILMFINPTYLVSFFDTEIGKAMMAGGLVMEFLGFLVIRKIVDVRY